MKNSTRTINAKQQNMGMIAAATDMIRKGGFFVCTDLCCYANKDIGG